MIKCLKCPCTVSYNEIEEHDYTCSLPEITCILGCEDKTKFKGRQNAIKHAHKNCALMDLVCDLCKMKLKR